jgi:hypothetical protein
LTLSFSSRILQFHGIHQEWCQQPPNL